MKIARFEQIITPETGVQLAGYDPFAEAVRIADDLVVSMLALDDGRNKALILGYDLLGMDEITIERIRREAALILGTAEEFIIVSCTHTHEGPHSATLPEAPENFNRKYVEKLIELTLDGVEKLKDKFVESEVFFYSMKVDANTNRRWVARDNSGKFFPHHRDMEALSDEFCDKELGMLLFGEVGTRNIIEVMVNYAAHPLAAHASSLGSHTISADYPGYLRKFIKDETGADCIFVSGAAGDMFPKESELGLDAARRMGEQLGRAVLLAMIDAKRQPARFKLENPEIKAMLTRVEVNRRKDDPRTDAVPPYYQNKDKFQLPLQLLAIGDVALVGVPGELVAELGQEIKWHSPFRKTFILYASTAFLDYLCHGNALLQGGYEPWCQLFDSRSGLKIVNAAVDALYDLKGIDALPSLPRHPF